MKRIALSAARDCLSRIVSEVGRGRERYVLESRGRAAAAIVGMRDLERIEAGDAAADRESGAMLRWLQDAERHLAGAKRSGNASLEALREVRENAVAEETGLYRRQRRPQARRRRGR